MEAQKTNGWHSWGKHVLAELERLDRCHISAENQIERLLIEIAVLKVKAGIWGLIGGALPAIAAIVVAILIYFLNQAR